MIEKKLPLLCGRRQACKILAASFLSSMWLRPQVASGDGIEPGQEERTGLSFACGAGDVTDTQAVVWARAAHSGTVHVEYSPRQDFKVFEKTGFVTARKDKDFTVRWLLDRLAPQTTYYYRARMIGKEPGPIGKFVTAPRPGEVANVKFAFGADMGEWYQPFLILDAIREQAPEFVLFLGDLVYADMGTLARNLQQFHSRHAANRRDQALQDLLADTSVYVTWDDHEVMDDYEGSFVLAPIGQQAFLDYWPVRLHREEPRRLYRSFRWGKAVELFILDTRQYRSSRDGTMLGKPQKQWLLDGLGASDAWFKFIATSVPFSDPGYDQWGGFPEERGAILDFILNRGISGVVFLSGDLHCAAVVDVPGGRGIKEVITGPLAQSMGGLRAQEGVEFSFSGEVNYGLISVNTHAAAPYATIDILDKNNRLLHRSTVDGIAHTH